MIDLRRRSETVVLFFDIEGVGIASFRDRLVAAPLKHCPSTGDDYLREKFPRPIGRGPVEAS